MAYIKAQCCIYCGEMFNTIHSTKMVQSDMGQYSITTTDGHQDGSKEVMQASLWCGNCDKTSPKISKLLKKLLK